MEWNGVNGNHVPGNVERCFSIVNMRLSVPYNSINFWNSLAGVPVSKVTIFPPSYLCQSYQVHLFDKNQIDAIFILSIFQQLTSTFSGHICSPSSGGILNGVNENDCRGTIVQRQFRKQIRGTTTI